jgi:hypothetical protein
LAGFYFATQTNANIYEKIFTFLSLSVGVSSVTFAQSITFNNFVRSAGFTDKYYLAQNASVSPAATGSAQTWDYSNPH